MSAVLIHQNFAYGTEVNSENSCAKLHEEYRIKELESRASNKPLGFAPNAGGWVRQYQIIKP